MPEPIRLIATDMDGTLLDQKGKLPKENLDSILEARERGIIVAIATGRFPENAYLFLEDHGLRLPILGINGARTVDEGLHTLTEHYMDPAAAEAVLETVIPLGAECFIFGERFVCTLSREGRHHSELSHGERVTALGVSYHHGPEEARECVKKRVHKFYICNNVPLGPVREALGQIPGIGITQSGDFNIEVMPQGVDKGLGIREYTAMLGIPLQAVMTVGDESNDVPMLRAAGCGVAVGNAGKAAIKAARYLTDTNDRCGFAAAVRKYALRE